MLPRSAPRALRFLTIGLLVLGYAGYYLCRSDFSVALPLLIAEFGARGVSGQTAALRFGSIASFGVLAYAIGKFPSGWLADFLGGRRNFLLGMGGSILFTILFAMAGGFPAFTLVWIGNRFVQSLGWAGIVKIVSKWFSFSSYGTVMGIISLSFLFGDAASRQFMSILLAHGLGWRSVFSIAAAMLALIFLVNAALLRESPQNLGFGEPAVNPDNLFRDDDDRQLLKLGTFLLTFARSPLFGLVCVLSAGVTLLRETFNLWIPTYFTQAVGLSASDAARESALFPLFGGISVVLAGFLSDKLGRRGRAAIIFFGLLLTTIALIALALANRAPFQIWLTALIGFVLIGPYSFMAGAMSLDFGGKQGSATASGLIDGVGYLGGVLAGGSVARWSVNWGWKGAFVALSVVAFLSTIAGGVYLWSQETKQESP